MELIKNRVKERTGLIVKASDRLKEEKEIAELRKSHTSLLAQISILESQLTSLKSTLAKAGENFERIRTLTDGYCVPVSDDYIGEDLIDEDGDRYTEDDPYIYRYSPNEEDEDYDPIPL